MTARNVRVDAYKLSGGLDKSWQCELLEESVDFLLLRGIFANTFNHRMLGEISAGTLSFEIYWKNKFHNVFVMYNPDLKFRCFYCNVNTPPEFNDGIISYTDLEIDLIVWSDFRVNFVDLSELIEATRLNQNSSNLIHSVETGLSDLLSAISNRQFPFDGYNFLSQ